MAVYFATKAFVLSLSEALHEELKPHGVKVSCLCPGPTRTEFGDVAGFGGNGLFDRVAMSAAEVVAAGLAGLESNRAVVVPGWMNKLDGGERALCAALGRSQNRRSDQILTRPTETACVRRRCASGMEPGPGEKMPEADTIDRATTRKVQVASLPPSDSGRGFARLPEKLMKELGVDEGDVIEITGKRSTAAIAVRPYGEDEGSTSSASTGSSVPMPGSGRPITSRCARRRPSRPPAWCSRRPSPTSGCRARAKP